MRWCKMLTCALATLMQGACSSVHSQRARQVWVGNVEVSEANVMLTCYFECNTGYPFRVDVIPLDGSVPSGRIDLSVWLGVAEGWFDVTGDGVADVRREVSVNYVTGESAELDDQVIGESESMHWPLPPEVIVVDSALSAVRSKHVVGDCNESHVELSIPIDDAGTVMLSVLLCVGPDQSSSNVRFQHFELSTDAFSGVITLGEKGLELAGL
jgi:hypothetical protein